LYFVNKSNKVGTRLLDNKVRRMIIAAVQHRFLKLCAFALLASALQAQAADFTLRLQHGNAPEQAARAQFERVLAAHDLRRWIQTREIVFEKGTIPHSHPVLTLNTRHIDDDGLFISTLIHEQTHWWLERHPRQTEAAVAELKTIYSTLPVGYPEGADTLEGSYSHLLVICIELDGVRDVLGAAEEKRVLAIWQGDHYTTLYRIVAADRERIRGILDKHGLRLR
jgi:hypothetical protein